ncbi:MAG: AAA family ATPase, partial [Nitrospinota bacterium]
MVRSIGSDLHMDYTAVGQTTHLAARMEQLAPPGGNRLTGETLRLAEGFVQVEPLGPVPVKGMGEAVEVFELTGALPARTRFQAAAAARGLTRFVGRTNELEVLHGALERAGRGQGQVVGAVGEAGVGKSRLFFEFTRSHRTRGWLILESGSASYGKATPYLPVMDLLKSYFGVEESDDARRVCEKVTGKVLTLDRALEPSLPALLALLEVPAEDGGWANLDAPQRRQRTLEAVKGLLLRESRAQPLLLVFEDLHWVDSESEAFLGLLIESLPAARLLLLVNYRPEYAADWGSRTSYAQLRLDPLGAESAEELLDGVLGADAGLVPLKRLLIERTEGNPFFLEESVRTLVETQVLVGERGAYRLAKPVQTIQVPATVQAVLAARIDRLSPEDKRLLQSAAVLGETVPFALLRAIAEMPEGELRAGLAHLQAAEFLYETSLFPDLEHTFKHGLTCRVAYGSLLAERRRALHAAAGRALETIYAGRLEEVYDRLANHYSKAEETAEAVEYLTRSAEKAARSYAHAEAVTALQEALVHAERLPVEERDRRLLELAVRQAESLHFLGRRQEILDLLLRYQDRLERLQDPSLVGQYYFWLGFAHAWLGHRAEAAQNLSR